MTQSQSKIVRPRRGSPSFARLTTLLLLDIVKTMPRRRALHPGKIGASKSLLLIRWSADDEVRVETHRRDAGNTRGDGGGDLPLPLSPPTPVALPPNQK